MALPRGWTATVLRYQTNTDYIPNRIEVTLLISKPADGVSFTVSGSVPAPEVDGAAPREVVQYLWPVMRPYAMRSIARLAEPAKPPVVTDPIVGKPVDV
jgi:hypothetical protein